MFVVSAQTANTTFATNTILEANAIFCANQNCPHCKNIPPAVLRGCCALRKPEADSVKFAPWQGGIFKMRIFRPPLLFRWL